MAHVAVVGTQWGDEGKGKIVDLYTEKANIVARFQGGNNAGHTLVVKGRKTGDIPGATNHRCHPASEYRVQRRNSQSQCCPDNNFFDQGTFGTGTQRNC